MLFVFAFLPAPPQLPVLHEESFLESSRNDCYVFGSPLELDDDRLALHGFGDHGQEDHVFRREGST